jgi:hypothetical protein
LIRGDRGCVHGLSPSALLSGEVWMPWKECSVVDEAEKLLEHSRLPLAWHDQRTVLGFA